MKYLLFDWYGLNMTKLLSFRFDNICCKMKDSRCVCIPFIHENTTNYIRIGPWMIPVQKKNKDLPINTYDRNGRITYT